MVKIPRIVVIVAQRMMMTMAARPADQHNTQMNKMMPLKMKPQLAQKTMRSNKKMLIWTRKLDQMVRILKQLKDLECSGSCMRI